MTPGGRGHSKYAVWQLELSGQEQRVLWLYGYEGMPAKQVAAELNIGIETTKSYVKRLRHKLRARDVRADSRVDLFRAALVECIDLPWCLAARDELLRSLLSEHAPERVAVAA